MAHDTTDASSQHHERNTARFFVENRQIAWVILLATVLWGVYAYVKMPKRKDPEFPVLSAAALCAWPGVGADKIEQLVTRKLEQKIAENVRVKKIESVTRGSLAAVFVGLEGSVVDPAKTWDDLQLKLDSITDLPEGAGPIVLLKDYGDTTALMLTVASPKASGAEITWRARELRRAIDAVRQRRPTAAGRAAAVVNFPLSVNPTVPRQAIERFLAVASQEKWGRDLAAIDGPGFVGVDGDFGPDDAAIEAVARRFTQEYLRPSEVHPDAWPVAVVRGGEDAEARLQAAAGDRYSLRELDGFTDLIQRTLQTVPSVSKVMRSGVLKETIFLEYSQEKLASYGIQPAALRDLLRARNITVPGGVLEVTGKDVLIDPSGEFKSEQEIGDVLVATTPAGSPVYLRDGVDVYRAYENPIYLNYFGAPDAMGQYRRSRGITLSVYMRSGFQIAELGEQVDAALADLRHRLPDDLTLAKTSDQPLQVDENISLFMRSLVEAIILVVLVALVGFWEWRSALLIAASIPLTLAMTFGMMHVLGVDLQQVSIASLILALGLLVDDPVVAGDAIKREMDHGTARLLAAWLGPTKLATAILFATITNIMAYLPMLMISGMTGWFVYSLPLVLTCSLVASRLVSMTFVPLLGYYLLRPSSAKTSLADLRQGRFAQMYYRVGSTLLARRKAALAASLVLLVASGVYFVNLRQDFFPKDLSYLSFVDIWLPEDANIAATDEVARLAEQVIAKSAAEFAEAHGVAEGPDGTILTSLTSFIGGGGPRFWFSVAPELFQPNYAQIVVQLRDKHETAAFAAEMQRALTAQVAGATVDVRQLETSEPIGIPVQIRISGDDAETLRHLAAQAKDILREAPEAERIRDNWGAPAFSVTLAVDSDRANLTGISNLDVALSSAAGMSGLPVATLREGHTDVPVVARLRTAERARLADIESLYVYSLNGAQKVPLRQVASISYALETQKIQRRNQFRAITVSCFPAHGFLASEVMNRARPKLNALAASLPSGYRLEIGGEEEQLLAIFKQVAVVLLVSCLLIFLALVFQFRSAVKPFVVFAAIPFGVVGALALLVGMGSPFGFMAFLGITSLIGVVVSHVIVLFDFIEEAHAAGEPLQEALLDAGVMRLRPVLITVGATIFALFPLAAHGGPLWEPLCYTQIGGLAVATLITLFVVPMLYAFFVWDLKIIPWEPPAGPHAAA
jgi:multidrug efflux pump subunit AcrB